MTKEEISKLIIGKEFTAVKFENMPMLTFNSVYEDLVGKKGQIKEVNNSYPEYTGVVFGTSYYHYPTDLVVKQIQENEKPIDESVLFNEVYKILTIICKYQI